MRQKIVVLTVGFSAITLLYAQPKIVQYTYDSLSRVALVTYSNGLQQRRSYDGYNGLATLLYQQHKQDLIKLAYRYNTQGQVTSVDRDADGGDADTYYQYDPDHNLKRFGCVGTLCPKDEMGHKLTSQVYSFDALNNIQQVKTNQTTTTYEYDPVVPTRLIRFQNTNHQYPSSLLLNYDDAGHLLNDGYHHILRYTPLGQVSTVCDAEERASDIHYAYNGDNQQVMTLLHAQLPVYLLYGQKQLLGQRQGQQVTSYLYAGQRLGKQTGLEPVQWYLTNLQGSVLKTDQTHISPATFYSPYGVVSHANYGGSKAPYFGFDGQLTDANTGWQFLGQGYRAYNAQLRRFMQQDSLSPFSKGGVNGYLFGNNDPVNQFDPSGHMSQGLVDMLIGISVSLPLVLVSAMTGDPALDIGAYMTLRSAAKGLFVAGNTVPALMASVTDLKQGRIQNSLGDLFVAVAGASGVISAQPDLMLDMAKGSTIARRIETATEVEKTFFGSLGVDDKAMKVARDAWVTYSSTASNVLMGVGVGLKTNYSHENARMLALSLGTAIALGYAAGKFYGQISSMLANDSKSVMMDMVYGSIRTGLTGVIAGASDTVIELSRHSISSADLLQNWAVPFAMGAFSGMTQQGFSNSVTGFNAQFMTFASLRMFYLFVKPPFMGAVNSGTLNSFFS